MDWTYFLNKCKGYDQLSIWHDLTLYDHIMKAYQKAIQLDANEVVKEALRWHDFGKLDVVINDGKYNHYPNHGKKSKEIYLLNNDKNGDFTDRVCRLISDHDIVLTKESIKRLIGQGDETYLKDLILVQKCDSYAHSNYLRDKQDLYFNEVDNAFKEELRNHNINMREEK